MEYLTQYTELAPHMELIASATERIRHYGKQMAKNMLLMAVELAEVREVLTDDQWMTWLHKEFAFTPRTAQRLVSVARMLIGYGVLHDFINGDIQFENTALYKLAEKKTPDAARIQAFNQVIGGDVQMLTFKMVESTVDAVTATLDTVAERMSLPKPVLDVAERYNLGSDVERLQQLAHIYQAEPDMWADIEASGAIEVEPGEQVLISEATREDIQRATTMHMVEQDKTDFVNGSVLPLTISVVTITYRPAFRVLIEHFSENGFMEKYGSFLEEGQLVGAEPRYFSLEESNDIYRFVCGRDNILVNYLH